MALDPVLYRTPMFDPKSGGMSREWIRYFDQQAALGTWQPWKPSITGWLSMSVTSPSIADAQFLRQGDAVFFKLGVTLTLGGTASNQIFVSLPVAMAGIALQTITNFSCVVKPPGGTWTPSFGYCDPGGSLAKIWMPNEANFTLGSTSLMIEGFYRSS